MEIIVVFNRPFVLVVDLHEELKEFVVINGLKQVVLLEQRCSHKRHLHVSTNCLGELKDVEVIGINSIEEVQIVLNELLDLLTREVKVNSIRIYLNISEVRWIMSFLLLEEYIFLAHLSVGTLFVHIK